MAAAQGPNPSSRRSTSLSAMTALNKSHSSVQGKSGPEPNKVLKGLGYQHHKNHNSTEPRFYRLRKSELAWGYQHPEFKRWRRRKDHLRWIYQFVSESPERTIFLTLGFCRYVTLVHAKTVGAKVTRWLRGKVIDSWVRVVERSGNRPHLHFLLRLKGELEVASGLQLIEVEIQRRKSSQQLGSIHAEVVASSAGVSNYFVKTFKPEHWRGRVSGKAITYSQGVPRPRWERQEAAA
jgi:hypothetical protein